MRIYFIFFKILFRSKNSSYFIPTFITIFHAWNNAKPRIISHVNQPYDLRLNTELGYFPYHINMEMCCSLVILSAVSKLAHEHRMKQKHIFI